MTHPITPPPELIEQWVAEACPECRLTYDEFTGESIEILATRAAQWGADQELEACLRHLDAKGHHPTVLDALRAARRPKPPSLKEQALAELEKVDMLWDTTEFSQETLNSLDTIRRALEQLDD